MTDFVERLRNEPTYCAQEQLLRYEAADTIEAQAGEIERLKEHARLYAHDPDVCNGAMTGEPPRYTPMCVVFKAEVERLREENAERLPEPLRK